MSPARAESLTSQISAPLVFVGPIITTLHGYDINTLPQAGGPKLYDKLFREGEMFCVGSEFLRKRVVTLGAPDERVIHMPMGVDLPRFPFLSAADKQQKSSGCSLSRAWWR